MKEMLTKDLMLDLRILCQTNLPPKEIVFYFTENEMKWNDEIFEVVENIVESIFWRGVKTSSPPI